MKDRFGLICASMFVTGMFGLIFALSGLSGLALAATAAAASHLPVFLRAAIWDWHDWGDGRKWDSAEFTSENEIPEIVRHQIANIEQQGRRLTAIHITFDDSFREKRVGRVSVATVAKSEPTAAEWLRYIFFLSGPPKPMEN